jgi:hypothetical protein
MNKTKSWHDAGTEIPGSLWLHYPRQWTGSLEGDVDDGKISFGEDLDGCTDISPRYGSRIAAGKGNSNLIFHVGEGDATLLGLMMLQMASNTWRPGDVQRWSRAAYCR